MEDESQDKRPRPRSPTISYRTDAESVGSQMGDTSIDMLDDVDKKILSALILGVDILRFIRQSESLEWPRSLVLCQARRWI